MARVGPGGLRRDQLLIGRIVIRAQVEAGRIITAGEEDIVAGLGWNKPSGKLIPVIIAGLIIVYGWGIPRPLRVRVFEPLFEGGIAAAAEMTDFASVYGIGESPAGSGPETGPTVRLVPLAKECAPPFRAPASLRVSSRPHPRIGTLGK